MWQNVALRPIVARICISFYQVINMYKEIIGKNLKYLRKKKNVTQISAEKMTGIDRTTISAYELAKREPSVSNLISLANYYKVTLDFLCGRTQRMTVDITDLDEFSKNKIISIINNEDKKMEI